MSGHSKWSKVKHIKAKEDAKRGKIFSKLIREIMVAARDAGGDPNFNPRLRTIINAAKAANMPNDNIDRAIKKGTGELGGISFEEVTYEGYGPGGVAIMIDVLTDNKKRTVAEIRHVMSRNNGNLGETGCVAWNFEKKGLILVNAVDASEDLMLDAALEAGAEDVRSESDTHEIVTAPNEVIDVKEKLEKKGIPVASAEITMLPKNTVRVDGKTAESALRLMDALEEQDDVQHVYSNFDIPEEVMAKIGG
ncbi:MAG: YebC/PmpR family DNA-binding transcriptional regulator [Candidatus Abyssobacteria bacterium SURF_17]|jgi:YebC/PmpR family DNA-binding regulatory protein|uniref:Probable transcriptional regulatory protein C4532_03690 n=1 Tax=Candidatus Abyssobacteria bacterium SURF_17 TaxID=2093361 RepID=A0A419F6N7_9BACT|nr:MAG: YebC/PmpR family DNA-binding transcriptional regulator [Candidatus Abyssubacteria bacterium SURF_17]